MIHNRNCGSAMIFSALQSERLDEGVALDSDILVFDLEDGTLPDRKAKARQSISADYERETPFLKYLRIKHPHTADGLRGLVALLDWETPPDGLLLPKIEAAEEIQQVTQTLCKAHTDIELMPIIESPRGQERVYEIASAASEVVMLLLRSDGLSGSIANHD